MRSEDGAPSVAVTWCDDSSPRRITVSIEEKESERPVAKFTTTKGRDHFATLNLESPGPDWTLLSGDPRLTPGITYRLMAWPGSGKEMGFGQSPFTMEELNELKPGQIAGGYPGETLTRSQFEEYAKSICG
ncbi:hypothetical protein AB0O28_15500 [Microbispora sp. NPDC088329]|uniref:hypothetical protein n=1 Tax=Microbispora sp. NPDC088329 TaxID=3154869 RepID=UPI003426CEFD